MATIGATIGGTKKVTPQDQIQINKGGTPSKFKRGFGQIGDPYADSSSNPFNTFTPATAAEFLPGAQDSLVRPEAITVTPVYDTFKNMETPQVALPTAPKLTEGLGAEYFQTERDRRKEDLRQEFFGPLGILSKRAGEESAGGRLGSGVGRRILEATVTNPFAQRFAGIDRDVGQLEQQERARVDELNAQRLDNYAAQTLQAEGMNVQSANAVRQNLATIAMTDSSNLVQANIANDEINFKYDNLANTIASGDADRFNDTQIEMMRQETQNALDAEKLRLKRRELDQQRDRDVLQFG